MRVIIRNNNINSGWGSDQFLRYKVFDDVKGWGIPTGDGFYYKEHEYMSFRGGDFYEVKEVGHAPRGRPVGVL